MRSNSTIYPMAELAGCIAREGELVIYAGATLHRGEWRSERYAMKQSDQYRQNAQNCAEAGTGGPSRKHGPVLASPQTGP